MTMTRVITCNTDGCLALYLGHPLLTPHAVRLHARRTGWDVDDASTPDRCPCCARGGLPVLERGSCPVCTGFTFDREDGEVCHYCGHVTEHPADEADDEGQEQDGEQLHAAECGR